MERVEQKTVHYRTCDFCGRTEEWVEEKGKKFTTGMVHFSICHSGIAGAATMDICDVCQVTVTFEDIEKKSVEVFEAMQPKSKACKSFRPPDPLANRLYNYDLRCVVCGFPDVSHEA